jgi:hypothetical protein
MGAGTLPEIMLAVKSNVLIIWLTAKEIPETFLQEISGSGIVCTASVNETLLLVKELL